ncbi:tail fiber domain-containing protein [Flavobacteriales bacterium]|nr:tail fiber domain-containing protein [Flavobacteriales bacterium]
MKKHTLTILGFLFCVTSFAQTVPQGINYQAVARDTAGVELINQSLTIQFSVISVSPAGSVSWQETHPVNTNDYGLFTAVIGQGTSTGAGSSVTFDAVDWGSANHYIKVELDAGSGFLDMGTTALMSVPYALKSGGEVFTFNANGTGIQATTDTASGLYSTAMGNNTDATGDYSTAMGNNTEASGVYSTAMGRYNVGGGDSINWVVTDPLFEIGNGADNNNRSNALTVLKNGNVGIGTHTPIRGKLDIVGSVACCGTTQGDFWYYLYNVPNGQFQYYNGTSNFDISVYADGRFMGSGIHIFSDERIKDVVGLSNTTEDLSTIMSLQITDYKMKDKTKGDKPYKKVIAQQVKEVYPQAISLTTEVVPDIYSVATIEGGYISLETDLVVGDKVRLIFEDEIILLDVVSADLNGFTVNSNKSGKVFVYGREVDDFHSVDYESISMLNVSATQELYKLILNQKEIIESLQKEVVQLEELKEDINTIKNLLGIPSDSTSTMKK